MKLSTHFKMVISATLAAFILSARVTGDAYTLADGYIHDGAYVLIVAALPIGGWISAMLFWLYARYVRRDKSSLRFVVSTGCLGSCIAWLALGALLTSLNRR